MNDNSAIQSLLETLSATVDGQHHAIIAEAPLEPADDMIAPLPYYGFLKTEGPDSGKFLQGQLTCDVNAVTTSQSLEGAYCTPKGRMLSSFRIARSDDQTLLMRMRRDIVSSLQQALAKYIVFSKAEQADASDDWLALGLSGNQARSNIEAAFGQLPESRGAQVSAQGNRAIQLDEAGSRFECWLQPDHMERFWPSLSQGLTVQGSRTWELLNIRAGLGEISAATSGEFLPQMLNFQMLEAISFTKGCYTGQEVVARMHYKGAVKRRLYHIRVQQTAMEPGAPLFQAETGKEIGNIVNAVALEDGDCEALAVITIKDADAAQVVGADNHTAVEILPLPYAISSE